ncbi:MAG TPA: PQQ-binding-like beta-propeller repeat protein [Thermomicrobiales bacterium]|nr:PQQ-binding-like beta-propeller repeat protein [Thermomicrobiales bacterium]
MDVRERRCGLCGQVNPPASEFCADCGVLLASVATSGITRTRQTQFALPDYLLAARERDREERRRRMASESGEGVGLVWVGAIAALLALWFGGASGIAAPVFILGLLSVLAGFLRLRRDDRNMARAGTATVVVSSVVLGGALIQTLGFAGSQSLAPPTLVAIPTPTADPAEVPAEVTAPGAIVPMFRGNAARTGENPGPAPLERPIVKWKTFVGGESYASPVVGSGTVYVATKAGSLVALRLSDGRELWRAHIGDYVARATPALSDNTLFVAAGYTLLAIDAETGKERWSVPLRFAGSCSPVVEGDRVFVATQEGHLSAFSTQTGEEIWHYRNENLLFGSPAVAEGVVVIADEAGAATAIDAESGRELWQRPLGGEAFTTPAIARGVAFVATNAPSLTALELNTGTQLWRREIGGESSPAAADGVVFLGGDDQAVRAIDATSGETRWSSPLGYAIRSSATLADDGVYIGSGPTVTAIDSQGGTTLWTHVTGGTVTADIAVIGESVIVSSQDGYVYSLGPSDGDPDESDGSMD